MHAASWQSIRPLPSSSLPLAQISGVASDPVDSVTVVEPGSFGYASTITQYTPGASAENVFDAGLHVPDRDAASTGLRSQRWLAPAR